MRCRILIPSAFLVLMLLLKALKGSGTGDANPRAAAVQDIKDMLCCLIGRRESVSRKPTFNISPRRNGSSPADICF